MTVQSEVFWMVWGQGQGVPEYRHPNRAAAETEAKRLAKVRPGVRFVVLKAEVGFRAPEAVQRTDFIEVPF